MCLAVAKVSAHGSSSYCWWGSPPNYGVMRVVCTLRNVGNKKWRASHNFASRFFCLVCEIDNDDDSQSTCNRKLRISLSALPKLTPLVLFVCQRVLFDGKH